MKQCISIMAALLVLLPSASMAAGHPESSPSLSLEQATLLRCSAAFAIVAADQDRAVPSALAYPPLQTRGKEYFVRSAVRLMDELRFTREQLQALFQAEVSGLRAQGVGTNGASERVIDAVMQPCLLSLEASGL